MKYIKSISEELSLDTYRSAANKFDALDMTDKANAIYAHINDIQWGTYLFRNSIKTMGGSRYTKPVVTMSLKNHKEKSILNKDLFKMDGNQIDVEVMYAIDEWKKCNSPLSLYFDIFFTENYKPFNQPKYMFTIEYLICYQPDEPIDKDEFFKENFYEKFEYSNFFKIESYRKLFHDIKSAKLFCKYFKSLLTRDEAYMDTIDSLAMVIGVEKKDRNDMYTKVLGIKPSCLLANRYNTNLRLSV